MSAKEEGAQVLSGRCEGVWSPRRARARVSDVPCTALASEARTSSDPRDERFEQQSRWNELPGFLALLLGRSPQGTW